MAASCALFLLLTVALGGALTAQALGYTADRIDGFPLDQVARAPNTHSANTHTSDNSSSLVGPGLGTLIFVDDFLSLDETKWNVADRPQPSGREETEANSRGNGIGRQGHTSYSYSYTPGQVRVSNGRALILTELTREKDSRDNRDGREEESGGSEERTSEERERERMQLQCVTGRMDTRGKFQFTYGTVEVRAMVPNSPCLSPAVWLVPEDSSAAHISMLTGHTHRVYSGASMPTSKGTSATDASTPQEAHQHQHESGLTWRETAAPDPMNYAGQPHVFIMEWTPDHVVFSVDGRRYGEVDLMSGLVPAIPCSLMIGSVDMRTDRTHDQKHDEQRVTSGHATEEFAIEYIRVWSHK